MNKSSINAAVLARVAVLAALMVTAGCKKAGPDYRPPTLEVPEHWNTPVHTTLASHEGLTAQWWDLFDDPQLSQLMGQAEKQNLDLAAAKARIDEAYALLAASNGGRYPAVELSGDASRNRFSENPGPGGTSNFFGASVGAAWEIDLFGKIARNIEAAAANAQAGEEDARAVIVALHAGLALEYINLRTFQASLESAQSNIQAQVEILELTRARSRHGLGSELDVAQAQRILEATRAEIPLLHSGISRSINNISLLAGEMPGSMLEQLRQPRPVPTTKTRGGLGLPADLLRQRPDIRGAERRLAAQTARIGVTKADLYPSLSLTGRFGFEAGDVGDLFDGGSRIFGFGPSLRWNLFAGGRIKALVDAEDARTRQATILWQQTVLKAMHEVENALTDYLNEQKRLGALDRAVISARRTVELSTRLYKEGLASFQSVLDAQQAQFDFENRLALARGNSAAHIVRLYAALGGGWAPTQIGPEGENNHE